MIVSGHIRWREIFKCSQTSVFCHLSALFQHPSASFSVSQHACRSSIDGIAMRIGTPNCTCDLTYSSTYGQLYVYAMRGALSAMYNGNSGDPLQAS